LEQEWKELPENKGKNIAARRNMIKSQTSYRRYLNHCMEDFFNLMCKAWNEANPNKEFPSITVLAAMYYDKGTTVTNSILINQIKFTDKTVQEE